MAGMFGLRDVLELVVYRFYDGPFSQKYLVPHAHQHIFHVVPDTCDQMQALVEEHFHEFFRDIPLIAVQTTEYFLQYITLFQRSPVVLAGSGDHKVEQFPLIVDHDVELEAVEPPHCRPARIGNVLEHFVAIDALVVTDSYWSGIHKGNTSALA